MLTLNTNVQLSLEKRLESMLKKVRRQKRRHGNCHGRELRRHRCHGVLSHYDLNEPGVLGDDALKTKLETALAKIDANRSSYESEEAYADARSAAINNAVQTQWRNKCIDSTYEPGSTFKPITLAAALEEGKVTKNSTFYCSGSTRVQG